jgi:signal transduction histidine kinase/DNA-binding response OmpR family regulator
MSDSQSVRILYLDDEPGLARRVQQKLERAGHVVDLIHDFEEGLARHSHSSYDVIVLSLGFGVAAVRAMISSLASSRPPLLVIARAGEEKAVVEIMKLRTDDLIVDHIIRDTQDGYLELLPLAVERVLRQDHLVAERRWAKGTSQESTEELGHQQERRNRQLTALNAVTQALSTSMDLQDILEQALLHAAHALGFAGGLIALIEDLAGSLALASHMGLPPSLVERLEAYGVDDALCDFAYREEIPYEEEDLRPDAPIDESYLLEAGFRSYVGAPIVHRNRALGTLCLLDAAPHTVSEGDYALLVVIGQQIGVAVENARLFGDVLREREVAHTLRDTAEAVSTTLQLDKLLERVLDELQRVVPYDTASIGLLPTITAPRSRGAGGGSLSVWIVASRGLGPGPSSKLALGEFPLMHRVIDGRQPVIVSDVHDEPDWTLVTGSEQVRAWLGVPLISKGRVIGILTISSHRPDAYTEETSDLAFAFAHQAALAIDNSRLYEQTRAHLDEAMLLHSVTAALSSTLDMGHILPYVARSLCEALHSSGTEIHRLDEENDTITVAADYMALRPNMAEPRSRQGQTISLDDFPAAAGALARNRPMQVQLDDPPTARDRANLEDIGAQAMLILPMVAHSQTVGLAIVWERDDFRLYTQGEIAMGQTLTHQAAIAIEHSRLFQETQQSAQQIEALYRTSRALSSSLEEEALIRTILEAVYRALNCEYALIATVDENARTIGVEHGIWGGEFDVRPEWVESARYSLDHPYILADIYRTRRTEIIGEWDERFNRGMWEKSDQERFVRILMPVQMRERVIGVVEIGYDKQQLSERSEHVGPDQVQMLTAFMDQAAVALENARLFREASRRAREMQFLHDVSLAAATEMRLKDTLQGAADALAAQMEDTRVALLLLESDSSVLRLAAGVGYPSELIGELRLKLGEGISGWVAQHGKPVMVPDVRFDPRYYQVDPDVRSELCVPLTAGPFIIGALSIASSQTDAFTSDDQRLLTTLASSLAVLVERVRLFSEVEAAQVELQQRARELEEANVRLQELDRLKDQFLANMSHELRTPLNSIIGFSDVLIKGQMGEMSSGQRQCVENILASGEHLLTLINDILDLSKIEAGRMTLELTAFDVSELLAEVQMTVTPLVESKSQTLVVDMDDDLPSLTADRLRVKQVLLNLLSNANKFTPVEGRITVSCRRADPGAMLFSVTDSGAGIKPEDQEIVFERFRQVGGSSILGVAGTGLGLAISKRLVEMQNGRIWVESEYGHGATFGFLLPIAGQVTPDLVTVAPPPLENRKVLVVEDDYQFSNLMALYLRQEGFVPIQHYSGLGVLECVREVGPALITLDVMLPERSGWEVLRAIKSDPQIADIPVLVITVVEDRQRAFSLGATDYLAKPVRLEDLRVLLNRLTSGRVLQATKVLIVEDDPEMVLLLQAMLPAQQYAVLSAYDSREGLALAREEHPDVILLDLMLPGMNGFEVVEKLRADAETENIPVIVLTAKDVTAEERSLLDNHIQGLMNKTALSPQSLAAQIRQLGALAR